MDKKNRKSCRMAEVYGFCRGVQQALAEFERIIALEGTPVYVLHELVHNSAVTRKMETSGAVFVNDLSEVPDGAVLMIGAHGVSAAVEFAARRRLTVYDTTCPRVKSLQKAASSLTEGDELVILCKKGHPEAVGVIGHSGTSRIYPVSSVEDAEALPDLLHPVLLVQTTMSGKLTSEVHRKLEERFSNLRFSGNICNASEVRQNAVLNLCRSCDLILVVGSAHSSNAAELVKLAGMQGVDARLIENVSELGFPELEKFKSIGITAGASTPDELIQEVKQFFLDRDFQEVVE